MVRVEWTEQAFTELKKIAEYISLDSLQYSKVFVKEIFEQVEQLKHFLSSGRIVPEYTNFHIRELLFGNYRIIYRYDNGKVEIISVYHSARILDDLGE